MGIVKQVRPYQSLKISLIRLLLQKGKGLHRDIGKKALSFQNEVYSLGDVQVVHHDLYTNGIGYVNLMFRANEIPRKLAEFSPGPPGRKARSDTPSSVW